MTMWTNRIISFHPEANALLESLRVKYGLKNDCEVLQKALQLLAVASSRKIYVDDNDLMTEVIIAPAGETPKIRLAVNNK